MKKFNLILMMSLCVSAVVFSSCSDDDKSSEEIMYDYLNYATDAQQIELYGKVKTAVQNYYLGSTWADGALVNGYINNQYVLEFNERGYFTKQSTNYSYQENSVRKLRVSEEIIIEGYDSRDRYTSLLQKTYDYSSEPATISYYKIDVTYNDTDKTATEVHTSSSDGTTWTDQGTTVYKLNAAGRIDNNQFETTPPAMDLSPLKNTGVAEYDEKGNTTLRYRLTFFGVDDAVVQSHFSYEYTYY